MNAFWLWFTTGVEHITDLGGYDHILMVTLLVLAQPLRAWKQLLILVTGFTVGHTLTLLLSLYDVIRLPQAITEFLIAATILLSAVYELYQLRQPAQSQRLLFIAVLGFGLIHGLGFSYLLRAMLGAEENVILPLLYFNAGLEAGQLLIVAVVVLFSLLLAEVFKCPFTIYKSIVVCITGLIALKLFVERFLELV